MRRPLLSILAAASLASAATTTTWEMNGYQDFLHGRLTGVSLSRDGQLTLAPKVETVFASGQPEIWSLAGASDGALYLGTGHRGRVYRVDAAGHGSPYWSADQPEVFALAVDRKDILYAATSPDGKVYRIENGKAVEYFDPKEKYIWALAFAPDGALFVGTGERGRIYRVTGAGTGELYYETGQSHITSLAMDNQGRLLAGSEPNGILYRIQAKGKAFALYDASLPEIRAILPQPDGAIYAAAMGGSIAKRTSGAAPATITTAPITVTSTANSVTVTDSAGLTQSGVEIKPKTDASKTQPAAQVAAPAAVSSVEYPGVEKSAVYRINPDNTVETLWSSKEENVYDLTLRGAELFFSTDVRGRIYRLGSDRKAAMVMEGDQGETTRLLEWRGALLAATGNMGFLYRLGHEAGTQGTFEAPVHDCNTVARWGRLNWRIQNPARTKLSFATRSGNSARPDSTWSDWSKPLTGAAGAPISSPNARYIQWRASFSGSGGESPVLEDVTVSYLPQNTPPVVHSVTVSTQAAPGAQKAASASAPAPTTSYSITVTDTGEATGSTSAGTSTQTLTRGASQQTQITWQADDADGDKLVYTVYFRGEGEHEWKRLKANVYDTSLSIDSDALADGRYYFRVVASDRPANPPDLAREGESISAPVLIDNTPPVITPGAPRRNGGHLEIDIDAVDRTSALRRCEYSVDAEAWVPMEAADGVTDAPEERYLLRIDKLSEGEHLIVIRVYYAAGNAGLAKVVVR